jgi:PAS domain S-box-containing protein
MAWASIAHGAESVEKSSSSHAGIWLFVAIVGAVAFLVAVAQSIRMLADSSNPPSAGLSPRDLLSLVASHTNNLVVLFDRDSRVTWVNPAYCELTGYSLDDVRGKSATELLQCEASDPTTRSDIQEAIDNRDRFQGRVRNLDKLGNAYWVDMTVFPVFGPDGSLENYLSVQADVTERETLLRELDKERCRLSTFVENCPAAVAMFDRNMCYLAYSRRWLSDFNLGEQSLFGRSHYEVFPNIPDRWKEIHRRSLAGEVLSSDFDSWCPSDDSPPQFLCWELYPWRSADGEVQGIMTFSRDLSIDRVYEHKARDDAERAELALKCGQLGLWDWNILGGTAVFNARLAEIVGETLGALGNSSSRWMERVHPDDRSLVRRALQRHFQDEQQEYRCLQRVKHRDGGWRWVVSSGRLVARDETGRPQRMVGTLLDVTAEQTAQIESRRSSEALSSMARIARIGWWELDLIGGRLYWSPEVRKIHEVGPDYDPMLEPAIDFYDGDSRQIIAEAVRRASEEGVAYDLELRFMTAKGRPLWVRSQGESVWQDGRVVKVKGAFQDITELRIAREKAEASAHAAAAFLANMSHELRTPLTSILGYTECLQELVPGSSVSHEHVDMLGTVQRNGEHLLRLINDVLDLSRLEADKVDVELRACSPGEIAGEVVDSQRLIASAKGVRLSVKTDGLGIEVIRTDPTRLRQILWNLVGNAVKFTEAGEIRIVVRLRSGVPGLLSVDVIDTGVGIAEEHQHELFKPFSQADASMSRRFGGTGLGLALSRRLARLLGGDVALIESSPGKGSTFRLTLRVERVGAISNDIVTPAVESETKDDGNLESVALAGRRILLAEDGPDTSRLLTLLMRRAGAEVVSVENGLDALRLATQADRTWDVLLLDMQMPLMDGFEVARQLRQRGYDGAIVALTAHAIEGIREQCLEAGCDEFTTKPIHTTEFLKLVARMAQARTPVR